MRVILVTSLFAMILVICPLGAQGVDSTITRAVAAAVQLDSVVVTATAQGFDVEDFIRLVQRDRSLYRAFQNLRFASHQFETQMQFVDKRGAVKSTYSSRNVQDVKGSCRTMQILDEQIGNKFYKGKKDKYRYYTAQLYDRVFVTHGTVCAQHVDTMRIDAATDVDKTDGHVSELKKLIFTPGRQSKVPLIGKKTEVFSDKMLPLYDFTISSDLYQDVPVYVFQARVKDEYLKKEGKTVFRELTTYFSKSDFQVLARRYHLAHKNALYMFDVRMRVDLKQLRGKYYPSIVEYQGTWNVPGKRRETGSFTVNLSDFR